VLSSSVATHNNLAPSSLVRNDCDLSCNFFFFCFSSRYRIRDVLDAQTQRQQGRTKQFRGTWTTRDVNIHHRNALRQRAGPQSCQWVPGNV
jgi:hypothetical protein